VVHAVAVVQPAVYSEKEKVGRKKKKKKNEFEIVHFIFILNTLFISNLFHSFLLLFSHLTTLITLNSLEYFVENLFGNVHDFLLL
jgi:hypothetical protein